MCEIMRECHANCRMSNQGTGGPTTIAESNIIAVVGTRQRTTERRATSPFHNRDNVAIRGGGMLSDTLHVKTNYILYNTHTTDELVR